MVKKIRSALGFLLLPGKQPKLDSSITPYVPDAVETRAASIRGYSEKTEKAQLMVLTGNEQTDVFRKLREVVIEGEKPAKKGSISDGLNLVVFRGVFGSGGHSLEVQSVRAEGNTIIVECDFENPGRGIRTTPNFTQPAAVIPLANLPVGKYKAKLCARLLSRSAEGVSEIEPMKERAATTFRVIES